METHAALLFGVFFLLVALSVPIGVSLGAAALVYLFVNQEAIISLAQRAVIGTNSFLLVAVPFFVLAGNLMNTGGITRRLFRFASALVGRLPGGLGHANVVANVIMAGMSGSAVADAAGLGTVQIPAMKEAGYDEDFSTGLTVAAATIGPIIPPSINMVVYAFLAEVSIGRMFLGGFVPGVFMAVSLMAIVYMYAVRRRYPKGPRMGIREIATASLEAVPALLTPVLLLGGMFIGVFTPTEAAVVASVYALLLGWLWYRSIDLRGFYAACVGSLRITATTMFIMAMASVFAWALAREQIPQAAAGFVFSITENKVLVLLMVNIVLLIAGCVLDAVSALIILMPILLPIQKQLGVDPIHYGVMVVFNITLGNITPPVGMCLYVGSAVAQISLDRVVRATLPFLVPLLIVLAIITYVPQTVLLLPNAVMGVGR
ncbi:MAG TPA: TRAP transporter large permease [Methylomirabilota bacterium]|jgi:tripartite ATP-independent transporter DctM subunit|nr:TRAP transporter large permease [Methylomirabilota bacterium]